MLLTLQSSSTHIDWRPTIYWSFLCQRNIKANKILTSQCLAQFFWYFSSTFNICKGYEIIQFHNTGSLQQWLPTKWFWYLSPTPATLIIIDRSSSWTTPCPILSPCPSTTRDLVCGSHKYTLCLDSLHVQASATLLSQARLLPLGYSLGLKVCFPAAHPGKRPA